MNLFDIAQYGVAVFSVAALVLVVRLFLQFLGNHLEHHTDAVVGLTKAVTELKELIRHINGR